MSGMSKKTYLRDVNPYLICPLCRGYLIDATTVVECLHSFCRSCILKHLQSEAHCPSCKDVLNKAKPNIKADKTLQDIVYKLVPGLYHKEMRRRKEFYMKHPEHGYAESLNHLGGAESATPEQRGEDAASSRLFFSPEDAVSLSLEYLPPGIDPMDIVNAGEMDSMQTNPNYSKIAKLMSNSTNRRYLQCPALVTIAHLKKFLALKYNVDVTRYNIDICHRRAALPEYMTLMDVAYIYAWKRNAPMRFFYIITKEEQQLEAPPNDRPSTPGLGASFPPSEIIKQETNSSEEDCEKKMKNKDITLPRSTSSDVESVKKLTTESVKSESVKTENDPGETSVNNEKKVIKTPIKILKTSNGSYEVLKSSKSVQNIPEPCVVTREVKSGNAEFSVVSIGDGPSSNGVKITLKQCSLGNISLKKPKVISNVLLRCPNDKKLSIQQVIDESGKSLENKEKMENQDKFEKKQDVEKQKNEKSEQFEKQEKVKRKVSFVEKPIEPEVKNKIKITTQKSNEQDKKQFLQSFELTANENSKTSSISSTSVNETNKQAKLLKSSDNKTTGDNAKVESNSLNTKQNVKVKMEDKPIVTIMKEGSKLEKGNSPQKSVAVTKSTNIDVYAFPNETPMILSGAIKRKCPPGLMISDVPTKKPMLQNQEPKKMPSLLTSAKSYRKVMKESKANADKSLNSSTFNNITKAPMSLSDTRNLLDECGLNIPAGLSITLTSPRSSSSSYSFAESNSTKDNSMTVEKVSPNISLNNKSVDPQVLKALKVGQMKVTNNTELSQTVKRKKEQDILDLSSIKNSEMQPPPLKVPQPLFKSKFTRDNASHMKQQQQLQQSQVVTLVSGQKYYRAPPGSLTPAAHRVADYPSPTSSRTPVYAPSLLSSPTSNSLSSAFPTLQSLYVLSQSPNLQQFQMDSKYKLLQTSDSSARSHLAAQCAPIKPPRSSQTSLAVPIAKQSSNGHMSIKRLLANDAKMASSKHVTFEKQAPSSVSSNAKNATSSSQAAKPLEHKTACSTSFVDQNSLQGAASPRVSSTVSPSPPPSVPNVSDSSNEAFKITDKEKKMPNEVFKSPESPDSSSIVEKESGRSKQGDASQSDKLESVKDKEARSENVEAKDEKKKEIQQTNNENFQKRLLAAFPSKEWANNPVAAEHLGNLLRSLSHVNKKEKIESTGNKDCADDKTAKNESTVAIVKQANN